MLHFLRNIGTFRSFCVYDFEEKKGGLEDMGARVLVLDADERVRRSLGSWLTNDGYDVEVAADMDRAMALLSNFDPDFVLADATTRGLEGPTLCSEVQARSSKATVLLMADANASQLARAGIEAGAYDCLRKPLEEQDIRLALRKAAERHHLQQENKVLREAVRDQHRFGELLGRSEAMQAVFRIVEKVAEHKTTLLIQGESGTGKELVARAAHNQGARAAKPFVAVNCSAIPEGLLESELFGYVQGAFTEATRDKRGLLEEAHEGTLYLDEVGELPLHLQVKLVRALQEGRVRRVGEETDRLVDVRVIAATIRDLEKEVSTGRFREDLFYRLSSLKIRLPPLRERSDDIPLLVGHFVDRCNIRFGSQVRNLESAAMKRLLRYAWPGNVRELENTVERAVVLADGDTITVENLPERLVEADDPVAVTLSSGELSIKKTTRYIEEVLIRRALEKTGGNRTRAAKILEISHRALLYKIKEFGLT